MGSKWASLGLAVLGALLSAVGAEHWPALGGWEAIAQKACFAVGGVLVGWGALRRPHDPKLDAVADTELPLSKRRLP